MRTHISLNPSLPRNTLRLNRAIDINALTQTPTRALVRSFFRASTATIDRFELERFYTAGRHVPFANDHNFDGLSGHGHQNGKLIFQVFKPSF